MLNAWDDSSPCTHYPKSLGEFQAWFPTDADCLDYLEWLRWPDGFVCPSRAYSHSIVARLPVEYSVRMQRAQPGNGTRRPTPELRWPIVVLVLPIEVGMHVTAHPRIDPGVPVFPG
jgi:hypothetical protein